jgi:hypothetical protein
MPSDLADSLLRDCRGAVGEVRFGFGSKRQVWAFEERHQLDAAALAAELAVSDPAAFLDLAVAFHDEFAAVSNSWRVRDRIQALAADLIRSADPDLLAAASDALVDDHLALRHWLLAAFVAGPPEAVLAGLESALARAYVPQDHWAILARVRSLGPSRPLIREAAAVLASLAQYSARPEDRCQALDHISHLAGPAAPDLLSRASTADADPVVRVFASELLARC